MNRNYSPQLEEENLSKIRTALLVRDIPTAKVAYAKISPILGESNLNQILVDRINVAFGNLDKLYGVDWRNKVIPGARQ
mgnify:CR=1 FL=1